MTVLERELQPMFLVMFDKGIVKMPAFVRIVKPPALPRSTFVWALKLSGSRGRLGGGPAAAVATTMFGQDALEDSSHAVCQRVEMILHSATVQIYKQRFGV